MVKLTFIIYQLTRPFSYLRIKHEEKWVYDWVIPIILTVATVTLLGSFSSVEKVVGENGVISQITNFVAGLPGFFIAALAAVATFNKNDIDELMANPPKLEIMFQGQSMLVEMTRRRFLCVLFSYLTAVSIFLVLLTRLCLPLTLPKEYLEFTTLLGIALYFFVLWQLVSATLLGLFYLGERLHTPNQ